MKKKKTKEQKETFNSFLKNNIPFTTYESINEKLGISKKMFTILINNPSKMKVVHLLKLSELSGRTLDELKIYF